MPIDPARAKSLFLAASDLADAAERVAFLDRECGSDDELRARVEALLRANDADPMWMPRANEGTSAHAADRAAATEDYDDPTARVGSIIAGKYKLIEAIGEGGMGQVFMAQQTEPVKRAVAVKVIKAGMDSKAVLARFEAERQALAMMDHPNIAKVLDAGTTDGGRPFFVMELVKGTPITQFCDERKLTPKQRLELFVPVCQAIQHAHQKGVIHRDIKPSNVLIALYDDRPVPKVIDFGVAKAAGQTLTEKTLMTGLGAVVGTAEYMSPEQASLNNLDIDTRRDVYSLGVLLYELLTGSTPVDRKSLGKAAVLEILRIVREVDVPKPSAKLSTMDTLPSVAANRSTEPAKLSKLMKGELDWLVLKALEKDRARRYETANGLARDILRYLSDEVVEARPPSTAYRLKKFVRRHKGQVIAASLVLMALVAGVVGTTLGLIEARRQAGIAEANEAKAVAEKQRAIEFRDKALDALRATTGTDVELLLGGKTELGANEKAYLEAIAKRWQAFARQEGTDEQARAIRAEGHFRVAHLWQKLGRWEEARPEYEQAIVIREKLAADFPAVPSYRSDLAASHGNLGILLAGLGKWAEAQEQYHKALVIQEKLAADFPAVPGYRSDLARSHNNLGVLLMNLGKRAEAQEQYHKALVIQEKLAADFPAVPGYRRDLARNHYNLGNRLKDLGKGTEAEEQYKQALVIQEKLAADFPAVPDYRRDLARSHLNLGVLLNDLGELAEAEEQYKQALAIQEKLAAGFPAVPDYRGDLARSHNSLGILLEGLGKRAEAQEQFYKALAIQEKLAADFPAVPDYRISLGGSYCNYGNMVGGGGRANESLDWFDKAIATLTPVHRAEPRDVKATQNLRNSHQGRATTCDRLQKYAEAVKDWDRAIELSPPAERAGYHAHRANSRLQAGQVAEAVAEVAELIKSSNGNAGQWYDFACVYAVASGKIADKKQEYADRAMTLLHLAVKAGFKDAAYMKKDADLDPLRKREDFKKLVAELEKTSPEPKPASSK